MVAEKNTTVDGQYYKKGDEIWDLGSFVCVDVRGMQRDYQGFLSDKSKLPKYDNLGTGSTATLIDPTGTESTIIATYQASTKTWYNMRGGVVV